jgi:hypothetical protein
MLDKPENSQSIKPRLQVWQVMMDSIIVDSLLAAAAAALVPQLQALPAQKVDMSASL